MKNKLVVGMLVICMALSATACGKSTTEDTQTETESSSDDSTSESSSKKLTASSTRLVSVDDVSDYVTIGDYKGLTLERNTAAVSDDDVEYEIQTNLQSAGTEVSDGAAQSGDTVTINFTGTIDGKEFDGGTEEDYDVTLGEGAMIDGFEDGLIGMKKGESKTLNLTFPDDYYDDTVAGKDVVYEVTIQKITRSAELTEEWVTSNTEYSSIDEYKESVRKELEDYADENADYTLYSDAWNTVLDASEVKDYPQDDIDTAVTAYKKMYEDYIEELGMDMSDFLEEQGMTEDDYEDECNEYAKSKVEQNLIVQGIMDAEGLSLDDEETQKLQEEMLTDYGFSSVDEMVETYGQQEVNESLALLRVEHFIVDNATINETTGEGDIANEDADSEAVDTSDDVAVEESGDTTEISDTSDDVAEE